MQILYTLTTLIILSYLCYKSCRYFTRPEPEILAFFNEILPDGKMTLSRLVVEELIPFRNYCNRHNIPFDPSVLHLSVRNTGDISLDHLTLYISIDIRPYQMLEHLKSDDEPLRIKKTIGEFQKYQRVNIPLIVIGFFQSIDIEFQLVGKRADSRLLNRFKITDSKSFEYEQITPPETKSEQQNDTGTEP